MTEEFVDIYDSNKNHLGVCSKKQAHAQSLWHNLFHCWVRGRNGKVWLQQRAKDKEPYAGLLSASVIGHIQAGESVLQGAREIKEELGIDVDTKKINYLFNMPHELVTPNNKVQKHFNYIYLLNTDKNLDDVILQTDEVSGIFEANISDLNQLVNNKTESIKVHGFEYDDNGKKNKIEKNITTNDLCPFGDIYYTSSLNGMMQQKELENYIKKSPFFQEKSR